MKILHDLNFKIYLKENIKSLQKNICAKEQFNEIEKEQLHNVTFKFGSEYLLQSVRSMNLMP